MTDAADNFVSISQFLPCSAIELRAERKKRRDISEMTEGAVVIYTASGPRDPPGKKKKDIKI